MRDALERALRMERPDELDPAGHTVHRGERLVELTRTEFLLLELLMDHPRQVLTRTQIFGAAVTFGYARHEDWTTAVPTVALAGA